MNEYKIIGGEHDGQTVWADDNQTKIKVNVPRIMTSSQISGKLQTHTFRSQFTYEFQKFDEITVIVPEGQTQIQTLIKLIERY